ncbi:DUF3857 domain-containing protein [Puteibacter caeruleilacunae]|nr:DUF3857 domain-containing protein [Puteibacter caeruleilacunae]
MKKFTLSFLLSLLLFPAFSQKDVDFEQLKEQYSEHNAIMTKMTFDYLFDIEEDTLSVSQTNSREFLILREHAKMFTNDEIYYSGFTNISNKEAYSLIPEGGDYKKLEVTKYKESHDRDGSIFYDDSKMIQFSYPSVQQGAKTHLSYNITYTNPLFIRKAYLQTFTPLLHGKVVAKVHKDIKIGYKVFNNESGKVTFKQYKKGKYNFYEWEINNNERYPYASGKHFNINYYSPHVVLYVDETNIKGQKKDYFGTIDALYKYYRGFIKQIPDEKSDELQQLVEKITQGLSDQDKVKAIYYWVQQNIKYLAYEQGFMGLIPSSGCDVYNERFGDCKGMSSLIKEMMRMAGVEGHYSWVGTRSLPYSYENLPLPVVDNHMIASYINNDKVILLDATDRFLDYGHYPFHIMDKEVLIAIDEDNYQIYKVPVAPASYSVVTDSVSINIKDNTLLGKGYRKHEGYNKIELAYALDDVKKEDFNKKLSRLFNKGNNKFKVESFDVKNIFDHDKPAEIAYDFKLTDYCRTLGDEIYVNMNLDKKYKGMKLDTTSVISPIDNDFYFTERFVYTLNIPEGYKLDYVPKDGSFKTDDFCYEIKYSTTDNMVVMEQIIKFEFLVLLEDKFEQWNKMIKQLSKQYRSTVALKKIK